MTNEKIQTSILNSNNLLTRLSKLLQAGILPKQRKSQTFLNPESTFYTQLITRLPHNLNLINSMKTISQESFTHNPLIQESEQAVQLIPTLQHNNFRFSQNRPKSYTSNSANTQFLKPCILSGLGMIALCVLHYLAVGGIGNIVGSLIWGFLGLMFGVSGWGIWESRTPAIKKYIAACLLIVGIPLFGFMDSLITPDSFWAGWLLTFGGMIFCVMSSVMLLALADELLLLCSMALFGLIIWAWPSGEIQKLGQALSLFFFGQ